MCFRLAGRPVEHDIGGGYIGDFVSVRINRILARIERLNPNTLIAAIDQISMPKGIAGDIGAFLTDISDDDSYMCDRHLRHIDEFNGRKARIDEIPACKQDLLLQTLAALTIHKDL